MRSKANIKSHPIHPILVGFPIAFFTGTIICDILSLIYQDEIYLSTSVLLNVGGIGFALLAAVPGVVDYLFTVPPESSAKKRATYHGLLNVTSVLLFILAFYFKYVNTSYFLILLAEIVGMTLMSFAGWMGGTLVYRNQIGVDIRYAYAGKWKELSVENSKISLNEINELQENQMMLIKDTERKVISRTKEGFVGFHDRCSHKGGSLAGGSMMCNTVQCPWHGSQFDVKTGAVKAGPAKQPIKTYEVLIKENMITLK